MTETTQETVQPESLESFIARNRLAMTVTRIPTRPDRPRDGSHDKWDKQAFHFLIVVYSTFENGIASGKRLTTLYSAGRGIAEAKARKKYRRDSYFFDNAVNAYKPSLSDIMDSLASDVSGLDSARSYEEWAGEYGYDTDSREGERIYHACQKELADLGSLLGRAEVHNLIYKVERL